MTLRVTRLHHTTCQVNSSQPALFPYQASISVGGIAHVPALSYRYHSDSHSLDGGHRQQFPRHQVLKMNGNLVWMCFILRLAPCSAASARAVLLSALARITNDSPISFSSACAKINSANSAPRAYNSDWTRQQSPVLDIHSSGEIDPRSTRNNLCSFESPGHQPNQHQNIP